MDNEARVHDNKNNNNNNNERNNNNKNKKGFVDTETVCAICLQEKTSPVQLQCGHTFCAECCNTLASYRPARYARRCPICRAKVNLGTHLNNDSESESESEAEIDPMQLAQILPADLIDIMFRIIADHTDSSSSESETEEESSILTGST